MGRHLGLALLLLVACGGKRDATTPPASPAAAHPDADRAETTVAISGTVVGVDGKPPAVAHVRVLRSGDGAPDEAEVDVDGKFELTTHRRGLAWLELTGVDHAQWRMPIVIGDAPITMNATLGTYDREPEPTEVSVMYWEGAAQGHPAKQAKLTRGGDGRFTATITTKAPEIRYQVMGLSNEGRTFNGPRSDRFEYDGGGDYRSVVIVEGGKVEVVIDPATLLPASQPTHVEFGDANPGLQRLAAVQAEIDRANAKFRAEAMAAYTKDPAGAQALVEGYDWSAARTAVQTAVEAETEPKVARAMAASYFGLGHVEPKEATAPQRALAKTLLGDMKGSDPAWQLWPNELASAVAIADDAEITARYEQMLVEELPANEAAQLVFERVVAAEMAGDEEGVRRWYGLLSSERFAKTPMAMIGKQFDPDRPIKAGKPLPAFEFGALPNAKGKVARQWGNEDLQGTIYLLDFWATWCGPCVADMPSLHAAYDKYGVSGKQGKRRKGRKFEILSISIDATPDVVHGFRKDKFPMPWKHAHVGAEAAAKIFGFSGIPFAVLVDERGEIVAATPHVSGAALEGMLEGMLAQPSTKTKG